MSDQTQADTAHEGEVDPPEAATLETAAAPLTFERRTTLRDFCLRVSRHEIGKPRPPSVELLGAFHFQMTQEGHHHGTMSDYHAKLAEFGKRPA